MATYVCPRGHVVPRASAYDLWCPGCEDDVIGLTEPRKPAPVPPSDDELAAAYQEAMTCD